jgi:hypothetical protein
MPKFKIESQSKHSPQDTFQKIRGLLENDKDLRKMDSSYTCQFNETAMSGKAKGSKFEADMKVTSQGAGSVVVLDVSLPMMLTPLKGVVQSTIEKKLQSLLA